MEAQFTINKLHDLYIKKVEVCKTGVLMITQAVYCNQILQVTNIGHTGLINKEPNEFVKLK